MNRSIQTMTAAWLLATGIAAPAAAQDYPTQTIRIVSSFGAGGGSDIIARILAQRMQEKLGQNVIVENRPGAGGVLGNELVANAPKDGYTLGVQTAGQIIASVITKKCATTRSARSTGSGDRNRRPLHRGRRRTRVRVDGDADACRGRRPASPRA